MAVMKQVVLNLGQPQYPLLDKPTSSRSCAKKLSSVKSQPAATKPSVTFEHAERDENIYKPQPTEFVSFVIDGFVDVVMDRCWFSATHTTFDYLLPAVPKIRLIRVFAG